MPVSVNSAEVGGFIPIIPAASIAMPSAEATTGIPGTSTARFSQEGHTHPRLTSTTMTTLDATGSATVTFTRSFAAQPGVVLSAIMPGGNQPVILNVQSWVQDSHGNYTGCSIKGYRTNTLPSTISVLTALLNFNIAAGLATGVQVSVVAIQAS